jgi:hypothetical protein
VSVLSCVLIAGWLVWVTLLVMCRVTYGQLRLQLRSHDPHTWQGLRARDDLDFSEPLKWYLRVRHFVRQRAPGQGQAAEVHETVRRLKLLLDLVEVGFAVLLVAIVAITAQNALTGAFVHAR